MQKNWKRASTQLSTSPRAGRRYPVSIPDVMTTDELGIIVDEELIDRLRRLEEDRQKVVDVVLDARPWEEEIAYVRRELQIRRTRREMHDRYVKQLESEYSRSEADLPSADLDNSRFLRIVGEIS